MINFKKGPALSLHQVNYIGAAKTGEAVVAGMVVQINGSGEVVKATITDTANDKDVLLGFAINNQTAGDVIESGKIGVYALDGASVVETDQAVSTINASNYPIGALLTATGGLVDVVGNSFAGKIIGQVEGIRVIPRGSQPSVTVLGVKLLS
jgi:hypothetical protein